MIPGGVNKEARQVKGRSALLMSLVCLLLLVVGCGGQAGNLISGVVDDGLLEENAAPAGEGLAASGTIQVREIRVASDKGGKIVEIMASEGESIQQGSPLVLLDATPLTLELSVAEAAVVTARADLELAKAGPRTEEVNVARAALASAEVKRDAAFVEWENAKEAIEDPQELDAQIASARTQADLAEQGAELAEAQLQQEMLIRDQKEGMEKRVADLQVVAAQEALAAARDDQRAAETLLNWLWGIRNNPLGLIAQANLAEGKYHIAEAGVKVAQEQLDDVLAGPTQEEIGRAEAALQLAESNVHVLQVQIDQYTITSPIDGVVISKVMQPGELAAPASTILTIADLSELDLVAYVLEYRIGEVQLGQTVQVSVDSFPGRIFEGQVTKIGNEPEFTPRNITTEEQRRNTFYQVEIRLPNPDGLLKAGMPADVSF